MGYQRRSVLLIAFLVAALGSGAARAEAQEIAVAVSDLRDRGVGAQISETLTELLALELSRLPGVRVFSYQDLRAMLEQATLVQMTGCDDDACWFEVGKALAADYLVHGSVSMVGEVPTVTVALLHMKSGQAVGRETQALRGDSDDVLAALRTLSINLVSSVLSQDGHGHVEVTPHMLRQLYTAQRRKWWNLDLRLGTGWLFTTDAQSSLAPAPLLGGRLVFDFALLPWLQLGIQGGADYQHSASTGSMLVGDFGAGTVVSTPTRTEAELIAGMVAATVKLRPASGLVLPYLAASVGGSYLIVNLGDVIPERKDLPTFLSQERQGDQGPALYLSLGAGVEVLVLDWLGIVIDGQVFDYAHGLRYSVYAAGQGRSDASRLAEGPIENLAGAQLMLGVAWQN